MKPRFVRPRLFSFTRILLTLLAFGWLWLPSAEAKRKTWHGTLGLMDVVTSDTPENTKKFICELLEVHRQVQALVAPVRLPSPRMQVLVFANRADYRDFVPKGSVMEKGYESVSGFTHADSGLTVAVVREEGFGYQFGKDAILFFYAQYLVLSAIPDAPLWVRTGLPELLAGIECRRNRLYLGDDFMDHEKNVRASKLIPLERLMDDAEMRPFAGDSKHATVLYHESWALWHQWLTEAGPRRREQVGRLFTAIRQGGTGDFATVAEHFGESKEAIEQAHRTIPFANAFKSVEINADASALVKGLMFQPSTELDEKFALAMVFARTGKGLGTLGYDLLRLAEANPKSPRPMEALAALALGENDTGSASIRWERARELNTDNPFAYLEAARRSLRDRKFQLSLKPALPAALADEMRGLLSRCVELDPASREANFYRALVEAFAPQPDKEILDVVGREQSIEASPLGLLYLAIARWRLGEEAEARQVLARLETRADVQSGLRRSVTALIELFDKKKRETENAEATTP